MQVDADVPLLHWIQPNLVAQPDGNLTVDPSVAGASQVECPYLTPTPPDSPHRYVIMLFEQPANWTVPPNYSSINPPANLYARAYINLPDFLSSSGLGAPIGATFFRALNGTAQQSASAATATISNSAVPAGATSASATTTGGEAASSTVGTPVASYSAGAAPIKNSLAEAAVVGLGGLLFLL